MSKTDGSSSESAKRSWVEGEQSTPGESGAATVERAERGSEVGEFGRARTVARLRRLLVGLREFAEELATEVDALEVAGPARRAEFWEGGRPWLTPGARVRYRLLPGVVFVVGPFGEAWPRVPIRPEGKPAGVEMQVAREDLTPAAEVRPGCAATTRAGAACWGQFGHAGGHFNGRGTWRPDETAQAAPGGPSAAAGPGEGPTTGA